MDTQNKHASFAVAAVMILLSIMLYDVMDAIIKNLSEFYPTQQLSMLRNLFGLIPTLLTLCWSPGWVEAGRPIVIRQWRFALVRGVIGACAQLSFYIVIFHLEFATATAILFAGPLFVTALSVPILGHRVSLPRWLAVVTGFVGVMLVIRPGTAGFTCFALLPLAAAFGFACTSVTSRLFDTSVPTALINLYYRVGSLTGAVALVLATGGFVPVARPQDWLWIAIMGIAGGTAAFCITATYRRAEPSSLSPFQYFGIPFSFCLGWIFFGETPFDRLIPGVFLIVGGGLFIIWRERRLNDRAEGSLRVGNLVSPPAPGKTIRQTQLGNAS